VPKLPSTQDTEVEADAQSRAAAAVHAAPQGSKVGVARAAMEAVPDEEKTDVARVAFGALDPKERDELLEPDQKVTNYIWKTIVVTFAFVLCGATAALVAAFFLTVEAENMQMLLTIFTTAAGILAGFVSGRASYSRATAR
jgi:hypothetical protein